MFVCVKEKRVDMCADTLYDTVGMLRSRSECNGMREHAIGMLLRCSECKGIEKVLLYDVQAMGVDSEGEEVRDVRCAGTSGEGCLPTSTVVAAILETMTWRHKQNTPPWSHSAEYPASCTPTCGHTLCRVSCYVHTELWSHTEYPTVRTPRLKCRQTVWSRR
jgi:hypothetical protein